MTIQITNDKETESEKVEKPLEDNGKLFKINFEKENEYNFS